MAWKKRTSAEVVNKGAYYPVVDCMTQDQATTDTYVYKDGRLTLAGSKPGGVVNWTTPHSSKGGDTMKKPIKKGGKKGGCK